MKKGFVIIGFLMTALIAVITGKVSATGMLVPTDEKIPPLAIKYQHVTTDIKESVAHTKIEQAFTNSTGQQLEATYIFPLPKDASIKEFSLYINGVKTKAELVEAGKGRQIYEDIVRRMKDPALLEYMDGKLFKMRVFPVPPKGDQKIELEYSQVCDYDSGMMKYVYPLKVGEKYSSTLEEFTMKLNLSSKIPVKNVYSPTHKVSIDYKGEKEAVIGFEEEASPLNRDFVLYWAFSDKDFGMNILARKQVNEDGYFMMMLAPKRDFDEKMIIQKDIVFVLDTSGSMQGDNIEQAKKALTFCVNGLNKQDRFNIVQFATEVNAYENKLVEANADNVAKAKEYINKLEALGATDIEGALMKALSMRTEDKRPFIIVFITDGKPTIGVKEPKDIIANIEKANTYNTRIFVFGVGYSVNTNLLDEIALKTRAVAEYVEPKEDIEQKISSFYSKASYPVLSGVKLTFGEGLKTYDMYPREMPDLFKGSQLLVFGRYNGYGDYSVTLEGEVNGEPKKYVYEATFPEESKENEFIERLWAVRRVGYLLEQIRLHGEEKEVADEVIRLSRQYGIVTPYTSFLVVEDEKPGAGRFAEGDRNSPPTMRDREIRSLYLRVGDGSLSGKSRESADIGGTDEITIKEAIPVFDNGRGRSANEPDLTEEKKEIADSFTSKLKNKEDLGKGNIRYNKLDGYAYDIMGKTEGETGVLMSKKAGSMKDVTYEYQQHGAVTKNINKRNFYKFGEVWVDSEYKKDMEKIHIKYGSEVYFKLLELKPELKDYLALGANLVLTINGKALFIEDIEKIEDEVKMEELEKLLK